MNPRPIGDNSAVNWSEERVRACYWVETPLDLRRAAETIAGEQSTGTFVAVPGETPELVRRHAARVESVTPLDESPTPSLPGSRAKNATNFRRGEVVVSFPVVNFGTNIPAMLSTLTGNLFELSQLSGLRLKSIDLPDEFVAQFKGPRFGVDGTRTACGVEAGRPMIGTIIKPSVGLSPAETAMIVRELLEAGIDFIKDDELMANPPHSPFEQRVDAVMTEIHRHADKAGRQAMYAFNLSDDVDAMHRHYDHLLKSRATCAMLSLNTVGPAGVKSICDRGQLCVHGHRNGWGMLTRHPAIGLDFDAYQTLWRLVGVDQIHVNGIANKFHESDDSVVASIEACRRPLGRHTKTILPVVSSGQWGGQAFETWRRIRSTDLLYLAGGGIAAHPMGMRGGVTAIRQAWQAAVEGKTFKQAAAEFPEFRASVEKFGKGGG